MIQTLEERIEEIVNFKEQMYVAYQPTDLVKNFKKSLEIIKELQQKLEWKPIKTAPRDGTKFIARIGNAIYLARYDDGRFVWYAHSNTATGGVYQKKVIDGVEYQLQLKPKGDPNYEVEGKIWIDGFNDQPTQWKEL
jgi:hypothetical protein